MSDTISNGNNEESKMDDDRRGSDDNSNRFWHTAGSLIEILRAFPADMPVVISGQESGFENFFDPHKIIVRHEPENYYKDGEFEVADKDEPDAFDVLAFIRVERE